MSKFNPASPRSYAVRQDRAIDDEKWIKSFLRAAPYCAVATSVENQPFLTNNTFVYDEPAKAIYMHTAYAGRFRHNLEQNPRVCLTAARFGRLLPSKTAMGFSNEYESVVVFGKAEILKNQDDARYALQKLLDKYFPHLKAGEDYSNITEKELAAVTVYRISIEEWSGKKKEVEPDFPGAFLFGQNGTGV